VCVLHRAHFRKQTRYEPPVTYRILHLVTLKFKILTRRSPSFIITVAVPIKTDSANQVDADSSKDNANPKPINYKLATSILLGDFFHNFADGIFLGTAFLVCSNAVAYAIVAATIYHEMAQELADYFLLTTHVGLSPWKALTLNFCSGLSVMFGAIIILALNVSQMATGCILAISAGVSHECQIAAVCTIPYSPTHVYYFFRYMSTLPPVRLLRVLKRK